MITFILAPFLLYLFKRLFTPKKIQDLNGKHVVITGGSSGIGKCAAIIAAKRGAHVTIIARNVARLEDAKKEITVARKTDNQIITTVSVDVSSKTAIKREFDKLEEEIGPIYMLVNCAGMAICGEVEDISESEVQTLINVNYLGTLYPIQTIIPKMKSRKEGIIVLTSSQVGLMGMFGYSVYSSCKYALRGLAESICMELKPYKISVTLALPPDTDTPGYENENKTKPEETKLISQAADVLKPEVVAEKLMDDALSGHFFSYAGFESGILTTLCVGMTPPSSIFELILQAIVLGPLRLIGVFYLRSFDKIVNRCHAKKQKFD